MRPDLEPLAQVIVDVVVRELAGVEVSGEMPRREDESRRGVFVDDEEEYERGNLSTIAPSRN